MLLCILGHQVLALYASDEVRRVILESILPFLSQRWAHFRLISQRKEGQIDVQLVCSSKAELLAAQHKKDDEGLQISEGERAAEDALLEEREEFDDYLELVIQFGRPPPPVFSSPALLFPLHPSPPLSFHLLPSLLLLSPSICSRAFPLCPLEAMPGNCTPA